MNDTLVDRLERHLAHLADVADLHPTPVATLQQRASARQRRRRALTAGSVVALVAAVGVVVAQQRATPQPTDVPVVSEVTSAPSPSETTTVPTTESPSSIPSDDAPLDDASLQALSSASFTFTPETPDAATLAIASALNGREFADTSTLSWTRSETDRANPSEVERSTDGVSWRPVATSPRLLVLGGIDDGDRIVLLGIRPQGEVDSGELILSRSDDGGGTWVETPIGESFAAEWGEPAVNLVMGPSAVAFRGDSVVFTVSVFSFIDGAAFLTPEQSDIGYRYAEDGIAVLTPCPASETCPIISGPNRDPGRTVDHVIPWSDIGIDPAATTRLDRQQHLYVVDADTVRLADSRLLLDLGHIGSITATDDGYLAVVQRSYGIPAIERAVVLHSDDGIGWTQVAEPPVQSGAAGVVGGRLAIVGPGLDGYDAIAVETDGGGWHVVDVDQLMSSPEGTWHIAPYESAVGSTGVTAVAGSFRDPVADAGGAHVSRNGVTMTYLDIGFQYLRVVDDATGEVIASYDDDHWTGPVEVDPLTGDVAVLDAEGHERAVFTLQDEIDASNAVPRVEAQFVILHSDDLVHWSATSINDVLDVPPSAVESIGVVDGRPVIRMSIDGTLAPDAPPYMVAVGTSSR
jgi:hypothetical protein